MFLMFYGWVVFMLSCGNDPVVNNFIYSNGDLDL